jgi:CRISPR-associated protein Cas1
MGRRNVQVRKIRVEGYGNYLKMEKGCFVLKDSKGKVVSSYPSIKMDLGEIVLSEGNVVSSGALVYCGLWFVDVVVTTKFGEPVAMLKNFFDDSHVATRIAQYESLKNGKALFLAKQFAIGKIQGQNSILRKYHLEDRDVTPIINSLQETDLMILRKRILHLEGKYAQHYFKQVYSLFPEKVRPLSRVSYEAYIGLNNVFNLGYTWLKWKVYRAVSKAHLEPFLGYLHTHLSPYRPSLVCDFMELYRYLIDDFLIQNCIGLNVKDFYPRTVTVGHRKATRMYLKEDIASDLIDKLKAYFSHKVRVQRIRRGKTQEIETLINEEALVLAQYLRSERNTWIPRLGLPLA